MLIEGKMENFLMIIMIIVTRSTTTGENINSVPYTGGNVYSTIPIQYQGQQPSQLYYFNQEVPILTTQASPSLTNIQYLQKEKEKLLQKALDQAWVEYGPKSKQRVEVSPNSGIIPAPYSHRDELAAYAYPNNNNNINLQENSFQPWESEWDQHVTLQPQVNQQVLQPGFFNRLLASYIDFEVNYHEVADFIRKAVVVVFIGVLALLWISVGVYLGLFPLKWLYFLGVGRKSDAEGRVGDHDDGGNDLMTELTDRIFLALNGDWLKKLEERIKKDTNRNWLKTSVQCCILPDAKTNGMADCQLVLKRARKQSTFKCLTDLIYNFQFGPTVKNNDEQ